jgi:hypothetical protein
MSVIKDFALRGVLLRNEIRIWRKQMYQKIWQRNPNAKNISENVNIGKMIVLK